MKAELVSIPLYEYQRLVGGLNEISKLRAKIIALESRQYEDIERLALDIAFLVSPKTHKVGEGQTTATTEGSRRDP